MLLLVTSVDCFGSAVKQFPTNIFWSKGLNFVIFGVFLLFCGSGYLCSYQLFKK